MPVKLLLPPQVNINSILLLLPSRLVLLRHHTTTY